MVFLRSTACTRTAVIVLGLSASLSLAACQSPTETQGTSPRPGASFAPRITYQGDSNLAAQGKDNNGLPAKSGKAGELTFKIKLDSRLIKGFGIQQLSNCAQDLTQIQTTLTLSSEVSAATQSALEQQGITVTNQNGQSTLTFNNTLAEVDPDTLEISYSFSDLPQGTAIAQTVVKDSLSEDFGFVDYNVTVDSQGGSTLNVNLSATDTLSRVVSCPQLAADIQGGSLNATGGDIVVPVPTPTPTPTPTPPAVIAVEPTVTDISATTGPPATQVIITGTGFETVSTVTFGGQPAFEFTIDSDTQITAYSASTNPVAGTVKVTNPAGSAESSATFTPQIISGNRRLFVSPTGQGTGSSWNSPMSLRYALGTAQPGDEVWVKAGIHKPTTPDGSAKKSFITNSNVKIYGGFAGTETTLDQRDPVNNVTILSGDLNGNDNYTDNSIDDLNDNIFHVFVGAGSTEVYLEGVTIQGGFANGLDAENRQGGGLRLSGGSMTLENVRFENNISGFAGGAIYHRDNNQLTLKNVSFENNNASYFGGGIYSTFGATGTGENLSFIRNTSKQGGGVVNDGSGLSINGFTFDDNGALYSGGALYNRSGASPLLQNGTFKNNRASNGGAVYTTDLNSRLVLKNVLFENNDADNGGAIYNYDNASPNLDFVRFKGNIANFFGGAMYNYSHASPHMERVAFSDNTAPRGGAMYNRSYASPEIINGVFHNNIASGGGGGGIYNYNASSPKMLHLTFYNNVANALGGSAVFSTLLCEPELISSVIWGESPDPLFQDTDRQIRVINSSVKEIERANSFGYSNINLDPFFVNPSSPAGDDGLFMTGDDGLRLTTTSPAKNFGSTTDMPTTDILGAIRVGPPEQGAYEGEFDVVQLPLQIEDLVVGTGATASNGDVMVVDYVGTIQGGSQFDSSYSRGVPFTFTLGAGNVITGWEQGLQGMQVGGKRRLIVPPHLGYGAQWSGQILPNSTLIFEIELLDVNP
jgi:predicted outer membrane repeat protein